MARPKITLYVDTVSPFAYEAYYILRVSVCLLSRGRLCLQGRCLIGWVWVAAVD